MSTSSTIGVGFPTRLLLVVLASILAVPSTARAADGPEPTLVVEAVVEQIVRARGEQGCPEFAVLGDLKVLKGELMSHPGSGGPAGSILPDHRISAICLSEPRWLVETLRKGERGTFHFTGAGGWGSCLNRIDWGFYTLVAYRMETDVTTRTAPVPEWTLQTYLKDNVPGWPIRETTLTRIPKPVLEEVLRDHYVFTIGHQSAAARHVPLPPPLGDHNLLIVGGHGTGPVTIASTFEELQTFAREHLVARDRETARKAALAYALMRLELEDHGLSFGDVRPEHVQIDRGYYTVQARARFRVVVHDRDRGVIEVFLRFDAQTGRIRDMQEDLSLAIQGSGWSSARGANLTELARALPDGMTLGRVVRDFGRSRPITVQDELLRLGARVDPEGKLRDLRGREIRFFSPTCTGGTVEIGYQEACREEARTYEELHRQFTVMVIGCDDRGLAPCRQQMPGPTGDVPNRSAN
jgi:hypothetical protein